MRCGDNDFDEVRAERALVDEIDCACIAHLESTLLVRQAGDPYDRDGGLPPPELTRCLDAVHHREHDVHQHDIGPERLCKLHSLAAVASRARDLEATIRLQ